MAPLRIIASSYRYNLAIAESIMRASKTKRRKAKDRNTECPGAAANSRKWRCVGLANGRGTALNGLVFVGWLKNLVASHGH
jgi:hypothetical protein